MAPPAGAPPDDHLPLVQGDEGAAVRDLQQRLTAAGFEVPPGEHGSFGPGTADALRGFQHARGLEPDGRCGRQSWAALVEAGWQLGDRLLYLRRPMLRGDDVGELQRRLGALGFDAGRVDAIFGPDTDRALREFQRNGALTTDGVCGPDVLAALRRLGDRAARDEGVAGVRERARLRDAPRELLERRVVIGDSGGLDALAAAITRGLHDEGARVAVLHHPDPSQQAAQANEFDAEVYVGLTLGDPPGRVDYYATTGFESVGGHRAADLLGAELAELGLPLRPPQGMRLPVLRETRMPAVLVHLAPPEQVVTATADIAQAVVRGLLAWVHDPLEP